MIDLIITLSPIAIAPLCAVGLLMLLDSIWCKSLTIKHLRRRARACAVITRWLSGTYD